MPINRFCHFSDFAVVYTGEKMLKLGNFLTKII